MRKTIEEENKNEEIIEEMPVFQEDILIMVIEDNITSTVVLKEIFHRLNCRADFFKNGTSAINKMRKKNYDIVVMDIELPDMNGFDILKSLRKIDKEKGRYTPVLATTAHILDGFNEKCLCAGMDEYMAKPIDLKELFLIINKYAKKNKKIKKIVGIDREQEIIKKVESIAFKDAVISLNKIVFLLNEEKYEKIKKESHKLKGSFSSIRRKDIENMTVEISRFSDEKNKKKIIESIEKINKEIVLYENSYNRG